MKERKFDDFDEYASDYDQLLNDVISITGVKGDYFNEYKVKELRSDIDYEPKSILDFGCGNGRSVVHFRSYFPQSQLFGIDVSEESIGIAKKMDIDNVEFSSFDGQKLPYSSASMNVVFTSMVFHHISFELHKNLLAEIHRVLTPNGRFYIFEHNPFNPLTRKAVNECEFDKDAVLLTPGYTKNLLKGLPFKYDKTEYKIFMPRTGVFKKILGLEKFLKAVPIGAQYYVRARK